MKQFKKHEYEADLWIKAEDEFKDRIDSLRVKMDDTTLTNDETMVIRGRIIELKEILKRPREERFKKASNAD